MGMSRNSVRTKAASGRDNNTARSRCSNILLDPAARKQTFMPRQQQVAALKRTELVQTRAPLESLLYSDEAGITTKHDTLQDKWTISLVTRRANMGLAILVKDSSDKLIAVVSAPKDDIKLEIKLFSDVYCIDILEARETKLLRRWSFYLNINDDAQAHSARRLWNHLCSTFSYMPHHIEELISSKLVPAAPTSRPPYSFRKTTLQKSRPRKDNDLDSEWLVQVTDSRAPWGFKGFHGKSLILMEGMESGVIDVTGGNHTIDDGEVAERSWFDDRAARLPAEVRKHKGRKVAKSYKMKK